MIYKNAAKTVTSGSFPFISILTLIFVVGKIWGYLDWSWWWVFSPIWISWGIVVGFVALVALITSVVYVVMFIIEWFKHR
jgi:hypothetical protein